MALTSDPNLLDVCSDVVVRFKAHESYGGRDGALKALRRRTGSSPEECREVFDVLCKVYDRAVEAIGRHTVVELHGEETKHADPTDIDFDACMRELAEIEPGGALVQKGQILNWVIFWHYLK